MLSFTSKQFARENILHLPMEYAASANTSVGTETESSAAQKS